MKKQRLTIAAILAILAFLICSISADAQYIRKVNDTTYVLSSMPSMLVGTLTVDGIACPLYRSSRGKVYYWRRSKNGNIYKVYPTVMNQ